MSVGSRPPAAGGGDVKVRGGATAAFNVCGLHGGAVAGGEGEPRGHGGAGKGSGRVDTIDAALAAYADPTIEALVVVLSTSDVITARRVAPWLRFAAERVAGELVVFAPPLRAVLELPACPRAKTIALRLILFGGLRRPACSRR
nr:unnamed protein product [Digitaria exilis]